MRGKVLACAALLAGALVPGRGDAGVRAEPILSLHLEGRWDENLVDEGGDASSLVRPGLGLRLSSRTAAAELAYVPDALIYAGGGEGRGGVNHRLLGEQKAALDRRTDLLLQQRFEQAFDPTGLSRSGVVRAAGRSSFADLQANLSHRLTRTWSLGFRGREEIVRIEDPLAVDGSVHAPEGWIAWALGPRDSLSFWYRFQYFDSLGAADATSHEPRLGWSHLLTRHVRLEVELGAASYTSEGETGVAPLGRVALVHRRPGLSIGMSYERSLFGATGFQGAVWGDAAAGVVTWIPLRRLEATAVLGMYQNGAAPDGAAFVRGFGGAAVLSYALGGDLAAQIVWRRILQNQVGGSDLPALDISRNIFAVGFSWELGRDRREAR